MSTVSPSRRTAAQRRTDSDATARRVLVALGEHVARTDTSPTHRQLAAATGLASSSISKQLGRLQGRGLIRRDGRRMISVTEAGWNEIVGLAVAADAEVDRA